MATTIRVYIDGGGTPYATGTMNADRSFSVPVAGLANGSHTVEVTAQEDGKSESPRAIQTITVDRGTGVEHPLFADVVGAVTAAADLTATGAPTQHALAASINVTGTVTADLTLAFMALYGDASSAVTTGADLTAPGGGAHAAPTLVGSTAIAYSTSAGITPTLPTVQAGDLLVIAAAYGSAWTPGAPPAGWTLTVSPNSNALHVLTRIATGSDSAPALPLGGSYTQAVAFAFRGASASTPIDVVGADAPGATVPSITTVTDHAMVITVGRFEDSGFDVGDGETFNQAGTTFGAPTGVATTSLRVGASVSGIVTRGLGLWYGTQATVGATGTSGLVVNSPGNIGTSVAGVSFAIRPQ